MKKFLSDVLIECGLQVSGTTALGTATATTVATSDNSTNIATTAFVKAQGYITGYTNNYITGLSFNTTNGVLTVTRQGLTDLTVDLDGRYLQSETDTLDTVTARGSVTTNSIGVSTVNIIGSTAGAELLTVDGTYGRLFTVTDDLSDSLFSVNTAAGLPALEVFADNTIKLGSFANPIEIDSSSNIVIPGTITASGYNDSNWNTAYNDRIASVAVSGTTNKTLTLTQGDGGTVTTTWTDNFDNYGSWNLKTNSVQRTTVQSGGDFDLIAGTDISISYAAGGKVTITSTATGSVDYISNVALNGSSLDFTGVGTAFTGSIDLSGLNPTVRTVYETVKNVSGAPIQKGTPLAVVAGQTSGNLSDVVPADASDPARMPAIFIANADIADEAEGEAVLFGNLTGVNTELYESGTIVYVAPGGGWTADKPIWPNLIQNLGVITKQHPTNGAGIVTGVGRANALPNLTAGKLWVGSAAYPIESTTVHVDEANGRFGIGTTSPDRGLTISRSNQYASLNIYKANTTNQIVYLGTGSSGADDDAILQLFDEATEKVRIFTAGNSWFNGGNVGIGTTSPSTTLHVAGTARVTGSRFDLNSGTRITGQYYVNGNTEYTYIDMYNGGNASINIGTKHPLSYISFESGNGAYTERMRITNTGNVGIGTTSPIYKLDVDSGNSSNAFGLSLSGTERLKMYADGTWNYFEAKSGQNFIFTTTGGANFTILNNGNVGIGTSSPLSKVHSKGEIRVDFNDTDGSTYVTGYGIEFERGTNYLRPRGTDGTQTLHFGSANDSLDWNNIHFKVSDYSQFRVAGSDIMRINSTGVGIGTTSPASNLHVVGNVQIEGGSTSVVLETNNKGADPAGALFGEYDIATTYGAIVDYVIYDAGRDNMRSGTFSAVWNAAETRYNDVSTVDIGDTSVVTLTSQINGANVELIVTGDAVYTIKFNTKLIK